MRTSQALTQDRAKLLAFERFDFDLNDEAFVRYYVSRTGDRINEGGRGPYLAFTPCTREEWALTCADIMAGADMVERIRRAKLQDCWEIYCAFEVRRDETLAA
jgi:hypothetical protein